MNAQQKKEMRENYRNRRPDMGVLSMTCTATGEAFLVIAKDLSNGLNRHTFQLGANMHPNKALQSLWNRYGQGGFTFETAGKIEYDDPQEDQTEKLEALLEACLKENSKAQRM